MNRHRSAQLIMVMALAMLPACPSLAATTKAVTPGVTIQSAIDSIPNGNTEAVVIEIAPGRYDERLTIPASKPNITLRGIGKTPADVWIGGVMDSTGSILTANADNFRCEHLTLEDKSTADDTQTRSALVIGGQHLGFEDCDIKGKHNTISARAGTSSYFHFCGITGTGDIVFGGGTAFIDTCNIVVLQSTGTIATPNTSKNVEFGFVFVDCRLSGPATGSAALMRPWGADGAAAFIRCSIDEHFSRPGWTAWAGREATCRAAEFASTRADEKPLDLSERPAWVHRLTAEDARRYTATHILGNWNPHLSISR